MSSLAQALSGWAPPEPSWIFGASANGSSAAVSEAEAFLDALDEIDRHLVVLTHGCGLDVGNVSYALRLDPSIASWRLRNAFGAWEGPSKPPALERGVHALLAGGGATERLQLQLRTLDEPLQNRLAACLSGTRSEATTGDARPGLGIGSLGLIVLAIAGFLVYGVIRDVNPLWRGQDAVRRGEFPKARAAFEKLGQFAEARAWIAITWLAEGDYDRALGILEDPEDGAGAFLGAFRPFDGKLDRLEHEPLSGAQLPRGAISTTRPGFVFRSGGEGTLTVERLSGGNGPGELRLPVPKTSADDGLATAMFPEDWPTLPAGVYAWSVPGSEEASAAFSVLPLEQRQAIQRHVRQRLTWEIPAEARTFLRGHYYLRKRLYTQAGQLFATLVGTFPEADYPRRMVAQISAALRVDPSAFLR